MAYISCEGTIRKDSSGSWWHCTTGFDELSEAELQVIARQNSPSTELSTESVERLAAAIEQFNQVMVDLFTFDPVLFSAVLFGCVILFSKGWGAGVVIRLLGKR